jgi:hypothetical protein
MDEKHAAAYSGVITDYYDILIGLIMKIKLPFWAF